MAAIPYMPLYVADYLSDAAHLSTLEHGAYLLLIMTYWQRGEALPADDKKLARICRIGPREWERIKGNMSDFFQVDCNTWSHKRVEFELQNVRDKSLKKRNGGLARAKQMHSKTDSVAKQSDTDTDTELVRENNKHSTKTNLLSDSKSDDTKSIDKIEVAEKPVKTRKAYTEVFEQFWDAYPTDKMMSKSNASKQFTKLSPEDRQAVIAAVEPFKVWLAGQKDYRTLHAERFISQRRFDGFRPDEGTPRLVASNFYAKADSAELEAWDAHWRLTKGKSAPRDKHGGWYFPSEWPPNEEKAA